MKNSERKMMQSKGSLPGRQKGALTMISAVLILILLTELIIYAVQVGVFEQRKSSNEMRQKEAFHVAESGLEYAKKFFLESYSDVSPQASIGAVWKPCSGVDIDQNEGTHPCYGEPIYDSPGESDDDAPLVSLRENMYFWNPDVGSLKGSDPYSNPTIVPTASNSVDGQDLGLVVDGSHEVYVYALLCMLDLERDPANRKAGLEDSVVQGCTTVGADQEEDFFMITLLARGRADCDANGVCGAQALITQKIGNFGPAVGEGGPQAPLVTRSTLPPGGTVEIVPNPDGGGEGVPISAWINQRGFSGPDSYCEYQTEPAPMALDPNGASWATCERHEWYGKDYGKEGWPEGYRCTEPTCKCDGPTAEQTLSFTDGNDRIFGMDLVPDEEFPCDLWDYMFGVPKFEEDWTTINKISVDYVKNFMVEDQGGIIVDDCDELGPESSGWIWLDDPSCDLAGGAEIGSPDSEDGLFLIVTSDLKTSGSASIFGTVFLTDAVVRQTNPNAGVELSSTGTFTIYGAAVIDSTINKFGGTFQVVYIEDIIERSMDNNVLGDVSGGWSDFHPDWR